MKLGYEAMTEIPGGGGLLQSRQSYKAVVYKVLVGLQIHLFDAV